jgi:hypothetical protein
VGIGACGWARSSAGQENFIGVAFRGWEHLERSWFGRAFACVNAFSGIRSEESFFASASCFAYTWAQWIGILARAIATFALTVFFVGIALFDRWEHHERFWLDLGRAFAGFNAFSIIVTEMTFFASASGFADTWAQGVGVFAGTIASFAFTVFFVDFAFRDWWEHHERFRLDLSRAFTGFNAFSGIGSEMTFFASASGHADTWAQGVGIFARAIASFALTEFFVIAAHLSLNGHGFGRGYAASFRRNAHAVISFQKSGFAEATDDAVLGADRARVRVGASGWTRGSATKEDFVFFACADFWRESEESDGWCVAFGLGHAYATSVSQMTFVTEASDDAVLGANWAGIGIGAGWGASRAAWIEKFIVRAFGFGLRQLHGDFVVWCLAILRAYTFTIGVLQESFFTETTHHALEGTHDRWLRVGTIGYAGGSTC